MSTSKYKKYGKRAFGGSCVYHSVVIAESEEQARPLLAKELDCEPGAVTIEGRVEIFDHYAHKGFIPGHEFVTHGIAIVECDECGDEITKEGLPMAVFEGKSDFCSKTCHVRHRIKTRMQAS